MLYLNNNVVLLEREDRLLRSVNARFDCGNNALDCGGFGVTIGKQA
jgi:hypothetical protein